MRVGFYLFQVPLVGGYAHSALCLARYLRERKVDVCFLSEGGDLADSLLADGFALHLLTRVARHPHPLRILELSQICARERLDVLQDFDTVGSLETSAIQILCGVMSAHMYVSLHIPTYRVPRVGVQLTIRESFRSYLIERCGFSREDVLSLPGRVDIHALREKCRRLSPGHVVLWMGRLDAGKGAAVRFLLEAWATVLASVPDARLAVAGSGELLNEMRALAVALGQGVVFLGPQQPEEAIGASSIVVGVERVAVEAMALGRPVVLLDGAGGWELATPQRLPRLLQLNFNPEPAASDQTLGEVLIELLTSDSRRAGLGDACSRWVDANLDPRKSAEALHLAYARALERGFPRVRTASGWARSVVSYGAFVLSRRMRRWALARRRHRPWQSH